MNGVGPMLRGTTKKVTKANRGKLEKGRSGSQECLMACGLME